MPAAARALAPAPTARPAAPMPTASPAARSARSSAVPARGVSPGRPAIRLSVLSGSRTVERFPDPVKQVVAAPGTGEALPASTRTALEQSLDVPLSTVRVHTDQRARAAVGSLGARAFTFGTDIFLGAQEQPTDLALMAHEVTHVIQQQGAPVLQMANGRVPADSHEREAERTAAAVQQGQAVTVQGRTGGPQVQGLGLSDILDGLAELAANVPGYTLLTLIIGRNPINMRAVERNAVNVLRAFMGLIPGGEILFQVLQRYSVIERLGAWITTQTARLGLNFQAVRDAFTRFTDSLSWTDIFSPGDVWRRARAIFTPIIDRITTVVGGLISQAITWLKETFMEPLAGFCRQIPGYGLVTVMLGRDPFTNAPVPRTALTVVRAFAEFIPGGTEKVNQLVESGALQRAYAWFQTETGARNLTWARVTGTFAAAWATLRLEDVLHPIDTLRRMVGLFRPLLSDLVSFAGAALIKLLELIYEAAMGAGGRRILAILTRARATFIVIIRNPVGFLRNLLGAVGQGVRQFMTNILTHLRDGVIAWLTGPVARAGIQMPEQWDLRGIIWFVLQILGLTWARVRQKLVRLLGERVVAGLEAGFQLLQEIRERGLVQALRDRVTEFFGNLRESALGAIRGFIQQRLVMAGIQQLLSLLSPVGAIIQAIIKTYTTVQFFIQRINQILDLVESIVDSIAAIASGAIGAAANFVERTMARTIPVILDFLARFIGLGDVGAQVQTTIRNLQASVDRMLDRAVDWIRNQARNLASRALGGDPTATPQQRLQNGVREGVAAVNRLSGSRIGIAVIRPVLAVIRLRHNMRQLDAEPRNGRWAVVGVVNPTLAELSQKLTETETTARGPTVRTYEPVNTHRFGTLATVTGLNTIGGPAPPSAEGNPTWNRLRRRMFSAGSEYYVRGHLINGTFGGPGNDWRNLTPLTQTANNRSIASMLRTFEDPVRREVNAGGVATIRVEAVYRPLGRGALASDLRSGRATVPNRNAQQAAEIADIVDAEESLPSEVVATGSIQRNGATQPLTPSRTQNVIDTDVSRYFIAATPGAVAVGAPGTRRDVNLSSATAQVLQALTGISNADADLIVGARPASGFADRDDFRARLGDRGDALVHRLMSTANVRIVYR